MAGNSADSGRSVTNKVIAILLTFTHGTVYSLTEIARLTGLPISTAHRLASELAAWGVLERTEDGHYRAGPPRRRACTRRRAGSWRIWRPRRRGPASGSGC
jgi:predicted transcriptional regulator of viral defense system